MSTRGMQVSSDLFIALHKEILVAFSKHYSIELKTLTVFQLYGFGNYEEDDPSLKKFILEKTGKWINGKYLYNKKRELDKGHQKFLKVRRDYLSLLILAIGYKDYGDFLKGSPYITSDARKIEEKNYALSDDSDTLYYIGYYVEDRQYYIKSKFTINKMKTASWEILYWERSFEPTFYSYYGKCVPTGDSALSFYFNKENSSLNKECFVNLFYGNHMQNKPVLLGAYCGFDRSNNPVIGKLVFEQVPDLETQNEKVRSRDVNPIFHHYLYSQRMVVDGILPHKDSDLAISTNRIGIVNFLIGEYKGFYLDKNNYLIPIVFQVQNDLGELNLQINNRQLNGIGRINRSENYLISEFNEKNNSYSQFSLQIQPLEKNLFMGHMLVYSGANLLNGQVLLWKTNDNFTHPIFNSREFYLEKSELDTSILEKINKYLEG